MTFRLAMERGHRGTGGLLQRNSIALEFLRTLPGCVWERTREGPDQSAFQLRGYDNNPARELLRNDLFGKLRIRICREAWQEGSDWVLQGLEPQKWLKGGDILQEQKGVLWRRNEKFTFQLEMPFSQPGWAEGLNVSLKFTGKIQSWRSKFWW